MTGLSVLTLQYWLDVLIEWLKIAGILFAAAGIGWWLLRRRNRTTYTRGRPR